MAFLIFHILVANYLKRPFESVLSYARFIFLKFECDKILVYLGFHASYLYLSVASP